MSIHLINIVWCVEGVKAAEKIVMLYMADRQSDEDGVLCSSLDTIAQECSLGRRTVQCAIDRLLEKGLIDLVAAHNQKKDPASGRRQMYRRTAEYRLNMTVVLRALNGEAAGKRRVAIPIGTHAESARVQEGGTRAESAPVPVQILHPNLSLEPRTPLSPPLADEIPAPAPDNLETGAVGKKEFQEEAFEATAEKVRAMLSVLPDGVKRLRDGRAATITEGERRQVEIALENLQAVLRPADLNTLEGLVCRHRSAFYPRPNLERFTQEFHEHAWKISLSGFAPWVVAEGFRLYAANNENNRRPRADQIAGVCREVSAPVLAAITHCQNYLRQPLTPPPKIKTPEERERDIAAVDKILRDAGLKPAVRAGP